MTPAVPVLSIVGRTNSGKTTFIEKLIPALAACGCRVATIKHHHHGDVEADTPGKDSWRHARAGAVATALAGTTRLAVFERLDGRLPLEALVARLLPARPDLILTEGFKEGPHPKVEVVRAALGQPPLCTVADNLIALVTDTALDLGVPRFALDDAPGVAALILARRA